MNIFVCGYSFAGLVSIKSWLEYMLQASGKSAWNLRNNRKNLTTGVSFHGVCQTVMIICLQSKQVKHCQFDFRNHFNNLAVG